MLKLYDMPLSGNCQKVRLMLSILGIEYEKIPVNLLEGEQKTPAYLAINPIGKVPAIDDDGTIVWDSQAILVYLAGKYGTPDWYPDDAEGRGQVQQWLSLAANEMFNGPAIARAMIIFNREGNQERPKKAGEATLQILNGWLETHEWLACGRPTIADIAVYPYAALAWEGNIDMSAFPAMNAWIKRVEALPGYVGMKNMPRPA
ncbi:MAG: glutathione S-transferase family protein [Rhodospirillales bacterium]